MPERNGYRELGVISTVQLNDRGQRDVYVRAEAVDHAETLAVHMQGQNPGVVGYFKRFEMRELIEKVDRDIGWGKHSGKGNNGN
jgi:hypothetical protein